MEFVIAQVENDKTTGLLVGCVPGIRGAHTQAADMVELCGNLREVLELTREADPHEGPAVAVLWHEEGWIVASCVDVGTVSQGKTPEEALANLDEATTLYLEEFPPAGGESRRR